MNRCAWRPDRCFGLAQWTDEHICRVTNTHTHKQMWSIVNIYPFQVVFVASFLYLLRVLIFVTTHQKGKALVARYSLPSTLLVSLALQKLFNSFCYPVLLHRYYHCMMWLATYPSFTAHVLRFCCWQCNLKVVEVTRHWRPNCQSKVQLWAATTQKSCTFGRRVEETCACTKGNAAMPRHVILEI